MRIVRQLPLVGVMCLLVGCNPGTTESHSQPRNTHESTFVWLASPAVDPMSSEGAFIRAFVESLVLGFSEPGKGIEALRSAGYPGFERAFNNVWDPNGWAGNGNFGAPDVGTDYFEVIDMRRDHAAYIATMCNYASMTATEVDGEFKSPGIDFGQVMSLSFGPDEATPAGAQRSPLPNQQGPSERPSNDVRYVGHYAIRRSC